MNLARRGGALWLLLHELRLALRGGRVSRGWRIAGIVILAAATIAIGGLAAAGLVLSAQAERTVVYALASLATVVAFLLSMFWGVLTAVEALYRRGDLDLLFSSPLDPRTVLTVRAIGIAASSAVILLTVSLSASVWLLALGQWRAAAVGPYVLGLAALAGAAALSASLGLFRLLGPRRTRTVVTVAAAILGGATFLAFQTPNFLAPDQRSALWRAVWETVVVNAPGEASLLWLPARALTGEPLPLLLWLGVCLGTFGLVVRWFGRRFSDDAAAIAGTDGRRRRTPRAASPAAFAPTLQAAVLLKELRLLRRDPQLLASLLLQLVYLTPLLAVGFFRVSQGGDEAGLFEAGLAATLTLFAGIIAGMLTWLMVSAEDAPDLIASAPQARATLDRLKAIAAIAPTLAFAALPIAALSVFAPGAAAWAAFWSVLAAGANAAIYTRHQRPMPRSALSNKQKAPFVITALSGFVNSMWSAAAALCAAGLVPVALIPAFIGAGLTLAVLDMRTEAEKTPR